MGLPWELCIIVYRKCITHSWCYSGNIICLSPLSFWVWFFFKEIHCFWSEKGYFFLPGSTKTQRLLERVFPPLQACPVRFPLEEQRVKRGKLLSCGLFTPSLSQLTLWVRVLWAPKSLVSRRSLFHRVLGLTLFPCSNHNIIHVFFNCSEFNKMFVAYGIV